MTRLRPAASWRSVAGISRWPGRCARTVDPPRSPGTAPPGTPREGCSASRPQSGRSSGPSACRAARRPGTKSPAPPDRAGASSHQGRRRPPRGVRRKGPRGSRGATRTVLARARPGLRRWTGGPAPPRAPRDHGRARRPAALDTPRAVPQRALPRRPSRRRPRRGEPMRTARPPRRAARECVRTSGPSAAPRPVGREGGGDPDDQLGGGWSGLPARRSRSCTWSIAFRASLSWSCGVSFRCSFRRSRSSSLRRCVHPPPALFLVFLEEPALLGQHPLGPRCRVPELDPVDGTVYEHLRIEMCERPQVCGDRHAALSVDLDLG